MIGFSLGGYISSLYALRYPEKIATLVLLSPIGMSCKKIDHKGAGVFLNTLKKFSYEIKRPPSLIYKLFGIFSSSLYKISFGEVNWIKDKVS